MNCFLCQLPFRECECSLADYTAADATYAGGWWDADEEEVNDEPYVESPLDDHGFYDGMDF